MGTEGGEQDERQRERGRGGMNVARDFMLQGDLMMFTEGDE